MKYLPTNTLAYYAAAPQVHRHNLSEMPTPVFAKATKKYRATCGQVFPNDEALSFYALNHCVAVIKKRFTLNEPLPPWAQEVMAMYTTVMAAQGTRMLHYVLSICSREMRHLHSSGAGPGFWSKLKVDHGDLAAAFIKAVSSNSSEEAAVKLYMDHPPVVPVGKFLGALSQAFHTPGNFSGGYGGPPWGQVADSALAMLKGETSMEQFVNTGYELAHNNGPIFNKGMMYTQYDGFFMTILDVQSTGQIPELILDSESFNVAKTDVATHAVHTVQTALPDEFKTWVDWEAVIKACPEDHKDTYESFWKKQQKLHPTTAKAKKALEKVLHGKTIKITGTWAVSPGQTVEVFERVSK
jgi:hypothetical protein